MVEYLSDPFKPDTEPTQSEVDSYAQFLGLDLSDKVDRALRWIAVQGCNSKLPEGWQRCRDAESGDEFYYHSESEQSQYEHPCDQSCQQLFISEKIKLLRLKGVEIDEDDLFQRDTDEQIRVLRDRSLASQSGVSVTAQIDQLLAPLNEEERDHTECVSSSEESASLPSEKIHAMLEESLKDVLHSSNQPASQATEKDAEWKQWERQTLRKHQSEKEKIEIQNIQELDEMKEEFQVQIDQMRQKYEQEREQMERDHRIQLERMQQEQVTSLQRVAKQRQLLSEQVLRKVEEETQQRRSELQSETVELQMELERLRTDRRAVKTLRAKCQSVRMWMEGTMKDMNEQLSILKEEHQSMTDEWRKHYEILSQTTQARCAETEDFEQIEMKSPREVGISVNESVDTFTEPMSLLSSEIGGLTDSSSTLAITSSFDTQSDDQRSLFSHYSTLDESINLQDSWVALIQRPRSELEDTRRKLKRKRRSARERQSRLHVAQNSWRKERDRILAAVNSGHLTQTQRREIKKKQRDLKVRKEELNSEKTRVNELLTEVREELNSLKAKEQHIQQVELEMVRAFGEKQKVTENTSSETPLSVSVSPPGEDFLERARKKVWDSMVSKLAENQATTERAVATHKAWAEKFQKTLISTSNRRIDLKDGAEKYPDEVVIRLKITQ